MFEGISVTDIVIFAIGFVAGVFLNYSLGKLIFNKIFQKQADSITVKSTACFEAVQQVLSSVLGFVIGSALLAPSIALPLFAVWLTIQTFLAQKIFGFDSPTHGLAFAGIDTVTDIIVGSVFGAGTIAFTLVRMTLLI